MITLQNRKNLITFLCRSNFNLNLIRNFPGGIKPPGHIHNVMKSIGKHTSSVPPSFQDNASKPLTGLPISSNKVSAGIANKPQISKALQKPLKFDSTADKVNSKNVSPLISTAIKKKTSLCSTPTNTSSGEKQSYSTAVGLRLKSKLSKENYAPDSTGIHFVVGQKRCALTDCETVVCTSLCGTLVEIEVGGNLTHTPIDTNNEKLSATDFNGNPKAQYYQKTASPKKISVEETKNLTEDDIEEFKNVTKYLNSTLEIAKKLK